MVNNFSISGKIASAAEKARLRPGVYDSVVISVAYAADYVSEQAIEIHYELTAPNGSVYPFTELFYNDDSIPRTKKFFHHLEKHGFSLAAMETFVGTREKLTLKKSIRGPFLTIEHREILDA
ncbi:MAG: hypothetical protein IKV99_01665 [Oscillospiraceae bacterium]|nr:hypothetical protein [Oscillospiraceae bacterium]